MRRLLILVSVLVLVDTMLYAALTPLLPHFARELHLSKAGAGGLVAAYAAGALIGGLPGGRAAARLEDKISDEEVTMVSASLARSLAQLKVKRRHRV